MCDFLDIHAAGRRRHHGDAPALAVERQAHIQLTLDLGSAFDINLLHRQAGRAGLLGDQPLTEHARGGGTHLLRVARELDAARLAATAGMHLRLDHPDIPAERLGRRKADPTRRSRDQDAFVPHSRPLSHRRRSLAGR